MHPSSIPMALLPVNVFQPSFPSIPLPRLPCVIHWIFRVIFLIFTILTLPVILIFVPLSALLPSHLAILPLHPQNLPPHCSFLTACRRGWWAYIANGFLWSITSIGTPPDHGLGVSRWLARRGVKRVECIARETNIIGNGRKLKVTEETIAALPRDLCVGVLGKNDLPRNSIHAFWLDSVPPPSPCLTHKAIKSGKVILWLAGGGYVTGYPLNDRPIFSLARKLPEVYRILAPSVSRALSLERSFPVPLLDALAAYSYLRMMGYGAEDITVIGNSAGGGLAWSLMSYLVALDDGAIGSLGVPRAVVMISPWLKLPPAEPGMWPDFVNTSQLRNAAGCYLGRFPVPLSVFDQSGSKLPVNHLDWLDESTFTRLSAHHPLISPSADISSSFVQRTLELLAARRTKLLIHCGTAEWFYLHSEACLSWPERGGPAEVLQRSILACL